LNGVVVLFSSPKKEKWSEHGQNKDECDSIGLFMETWTDEEFQAVEGSQYPRPLVLPHFKDIDSFKQGLKLLGIYDKDPSDIKRIDLFGRQPRYEFALDENLILRRIDGIADELKRIKFNFDIFDNLTHQFISTEYNVNNGTVYTKYISEFLFQIIKKKIQSVDSTVIQTLFNNVPLQFKGSVFEPLVRRKISEGFFGKVRFFDDDVSEDIYFDPVIFEQYFYCQVRDKIQMLYEDVNMTRLLGAIYIDRATHYLPSTYRTYDFDDILVFPQFEKGICHVLFIQITTDHKHNVALGGFFGMLWFLLTVSHTLSCEVIPWFLFFVTKSNFTLFKEPQIKRLNVYFQNIRILIVCESDSKTVAKEHNFLNFLSKSVNSEKDENYSPKVLQEENDSILLPSVPNDEDIFDKETSDLIIDEYITTRLSLQRPSFINHHDFIWKRGIICSIKDKGVTITNNNKKKITLDTNLHRTVYSSSMSKKSISKSSKVQSILLKDPERNLNKNLDCYSLNNDDFQSEFDFTKGYSKLLFTNLSSSSKKNCIKQIFSTCFKPQIVCMLVYGMILNVQIIKKDPKASNKKYYSLKLYFNNDSDFEKAKNILPKYKYLIESPFNSE
jgi:hypothetical protein